MKSKSNPMLLVIILMASVSCASTIEKMALSDSTGVVSVYLANYGWHNTGLIIPQASIPDHLWPERADFPDRHYLEIGWGDRDYYQARRPGLWMTFKAALLPTSSVLYVIGRKEMVMPLASQYEIIELVLSCEAFYQLCQYVHDSFDRAGSARSAVLASSAYTDGRFYPVQGSFHLFRTCNVWTAGALRAAGIPVSIFSSISVGSLVSQASQFAVPKRCVRTDCNGLSMEPEPVNWR